MYHRIPVVEHSILMDPDVTLATEERVWSAVTTVHNRWMVLTLLADSCCHMLFAHHGVDKPASLFRPPPWYQTLLSRPIGVSARHSSLPSERPSSWKKASVKTMHNIENHWFQKLWTDESQPSDSGCYWWAVKRICFPSWLDFFFILHHYLRRIFFF